MPACGSNVVVHCHDPDSEIMYNWGFQQVVKEKVDYGGRGGRFEGNLGKKLDRLLNES